MKRTTPLSWVLVCGVLMWGASAAQAQSLGTPAGELRRDLRAIDPEEHIRRLASIQSRYTGYPGCREAERYIYEHYEALGLANLSRKPFQIIVPVDKGAALRVGEHSITIHCVRPNYVRTPKTPEAGLSGPLVWGGEGYLKDFNGKDIEGSIALMNFNTATRWLNAANLGAKAIVFVESPHAFRTDAEQKYLQVPVPVPRYYLERKELPALAAAVRGGEAGDFDPEQALAVIEDLGSGTTPSGTIRADMIWDESTVYMISGEVPGTDPELGRQTLVCHAYYDSTSVVPALSPGAESACGIAAQLEIAEFFLKHPPRRTVKFLATPGHFQALAGVREYAFNKIFNRRQEVSGSEKAALAGEPSFFIGLDLSSRENSMAGFFKGHFYDQDNLDETKLQRFFSDYSALLVELAEQVVGPGRLLEDLQFQSGIVPQHGRKWRSLLPDTAAFDSEVITLSGRPAITLATTGDSRNAVDTPLDSFEGIRAYLHNVRGQAILSAYLIKQTADLPHIPLNGKLELDRVGSIFGRAIEQSLSAYVPTINVPGIVGAVNLSEDKSMMGVKGRSFVRSDVQGLFEVFGLNIASGQVVVDGFVLSPSDGSVKSVAKPELVIPARGKRLEWELRRTDLRLNFYECVSTTIFDLMDPLWMLLPTEAVALRAEANSPVRTDDLVVFTGTHISGTSYSEPAAVFFTKPGLRLKFTHDGGVLLNVRVLDSALSATGSADAPEERQKDERLSRTATTEEYLGLGFATDEPENLIYRTAYRMATDMYLLNDWRLTGLQKAAISKKNVRDLHGEVRQHLIAARQKLSERRYGEFYQEVGLAWALAGRVYPEVRGTADDVVRGVIFYFALLLPFVIFAERLLLNYVDIRKKLVAIGVLFAISYSVLHLVHPAFRLSQTPVIILDGFFMVVASAWTIAYLIMRFQGTMEVVRGHIRMLHRADVARASATMTAFILGISNMRKRKMRTALTALTLILLTFTILSFTSFETMPARMLRFRSPKPAPYEGLLVRSLAWSQLSEFQNYDLINHFRTEGLTVAPRSWFVSRDPNEELRLRITPTAGPSRSPAIASALLGLSPEEDALSGIADYLTHGTWFDPHAPVPQAGESNPGDGGEGEGQESNWPFVCIVPSGMMESLHLEPKDAGRARLSVLGRELTVVGFLHGRDFFTYRDLDEEPLTPVDFVEQQFKKQAAAPGTGPSLTATGDTTAEDFISAMRKTKQEGLYIHMDPNRVLIVPHELCMKLGGTMRGVAVGPGTQESGAALERSVLHWVSVFASRVNLPLYAGIEGFINRVATRSRLSIGGLEGLLVPILIASLIVFNTMLGAVYERVGEIKVYASVGLAPIHIGALFFAESSVFAVLGAMLGYLLGQVISFILIHVPWLMEGISLNYSSVSAVWSAVLVMAVVLASTAYPARMAGKLSVPDETRKMQLPKPEGDVWNIWFPFTVSSRETLGVMAYLHEYFESNDEDSVGAFTADNIAFFAEQKEGRQIILQSDVWVAPLDMGISQNVRIASVPDSEEPDITYLFFTITRKSGEFATWHRMNLGFLKDLRKQLLIWRLVLPEEKKRLAEEGEELLRRANQACPD